MKDITVCLIEPTISGNLGAIARSMANFGFSDLILVNPKCDKDDDESRNRAKHAQKILDDTKIVDSFKKIVDTHNIVIGTTGVTGVDYNIPRSPVLPTALCELLTGKSGNVALVFGTEADGLTNEQIGKCDFVVTIPTSKEYPIMNLSHAVTILLYELSKNKFGKQVKEIHPQATQKDKEITLEVLNELFEQTQFSTQTEEETQRKVWKRLIGKGMLTRREIFALIGFLKKLKK